MYKLCIGLWKMMKPAQVSSKHYLVSQNIRNFWPSLFILLSVAYFPQCHLSDCLQCFLSYKSCTHVRTGANIFKFKSNYQERTNPASQKEILMPCASYHKSERSEELLWEQFKRGTGEEIL